MREYLFNFLPASFQQLISKAFTILRYAYKLTTQHFITTSLFCI